MTPLLNSLMVRTPTCPVIKPAVELRAPLLLTIAAAGVALLLVMIIRFKDPGLRGPADRHSWWPWPRKYSATKTFSPWWPPGWEAPWAGSPS